MYTFILLLVLELKQSEKYLKDVINLKSKIKNHPLDLWANPHLFEKNQRNLVELSSVITSPEFWDAPSFLAQAAKFEALENFVDLFDRAIKELKASRDYSLEDKVIRFKEIVNHYLSILKVLNSKVTGLPNREVGDTPAQVIESWERIFKKFSNDESQLYPSPGFSVINFALGSTTSFSSEMIQSTEDIFTLVHQSLNTVISKEFSNAIGDSFIYPKEIVKARQMMIDFTPWQIDFLGFELGKNRCTMKYSLPMKNHAMKVDLTLWQEEEPRISASYSFLGDRFERWQVIHKFIKAYAALRGMNNQFEILNYNQTEVSFEFKDFFSLSDNSIDRLNKTLMILANGDSSIQFDVLLDPCHSENNYCIDTIHKLEDSYIQSNLFISLIDNQHALNDALKHAKKAFKTGSAESKRVALELWVKLFSLNNLPQNKKNLISTAVEAIQESYLNGGDDEKSDYILLMTELSQRRRSAFNDMINQFPSKLLENLVLDGIEGNENYRKSSLSFINRNKDLISNAKIKKAISNIEKKEPLNLDDKYDKDLALADIYNILRSEIEESKLVKFLEEIKTNPSPKLRERVIELLVGLFNNHKYSPKYSPKLSDSFFSQNVVDFLRGCLGIDSMELNKEESMWLMIKEFDLIKNLVEFSDSAVDFAYAKAFPIIFIVDELEEDGMSHKLKTNLVRNALLILEKILNKDRPKLKNEINKKAHSAWEKCLKSHALQLWLLLAKKGQVFEGLEKKLHDFFIDKANASSTWPLREFWDVLLEKGRGFEEAYSVAKNLFNQKNPDSFYIMSQLVKYDKYHNDGLKMVVIELEDDEKNYDRNQLRDALHAKGYLQD